MLDLITKYQNLPNDLRGKMSTPLVMAEIEKIETEYKVDLATLIMKIMIKDTPLEKIPSFFAIEYNFNTERAEEVANKIKENVLKSVKDYLQTDIEPTKPIMPVLNTNLVQPAKKSAANFFFSPDDENEIRQIAEKIKTSTENDINKEINEKIGKAMTITGTVFSSILMEERFCQILVTYLRGIRNKIETIETMTRSHESGGLSMDRELAEKIIKVLNTKDEVVKTVAVDQLDIKKEPASVDEMIDDLKPKSAKIDILAELQSKGMRDIEYNLAAELEKKKAEKERINKIILETELEKIKPAEQPVVSSSVVTDAVKEAQKIVDEAEPEDPTDIFLEELHLDHELMPPTPAPIVVSKQEIRQEAPGVMSIKPQMIKNEMTQSQTEKEKPTVEITKEPVKKIEFIRPVNIEGKVKMEDVKYVPHVLDPIDELRYFNLVNFRRLSKEPHEATAKINEKIELLKKEKFSKGIEAIKAWRESQVNKLYIAMGHECIENKITIEEVIQKRKNSNQECLEVNEFDAIMDLNRSLRF